MAVERVKPVDRQLRRAVKKLSQLQTQPLTAEEEAQEGQELLTPALSKWMRRMVRAVQPDGAAPANVTPVGRRRRLLPSTPSDTPRRGIGNRSKHQTKGIFFRTLLFSYMCPIDVDRHKPDISNRRSFRDVGTTRYESPRDGQ